MKYNLQELEELFGIDSGTLRYYDKRNIIPKFKRDEHGYRYIDEKDITYIMLVRILKACAFKIKEIEKIIKLNDEVDEFENSEEYQETAFKIADFFDSHVNELLEHQREITHQIEATLYMQKYYIGCATGKYTDSEEIVETLYEKAPQYVKDNMVKPDITEKAINAYYKEKSENNTDESK